MHTKGPWDISWGTYQDGEGHEVCEYRKQGQELACIAKVCFHDDEDGETKANARLIAAAPEMLAALREAYDAISDGLLNGFRANSGTYALPLITQAIAKAEGK